MLRSFFSVALGAAILLGPRLARAGGPAELKLQAPAGWTNVTRDGTQVLVPGDLAAGKFYTVVVPDLPNKLGSVDALLEAGLASVRETGTFKAARDPANSRTDTDWDFRVVIGTLEKDGKTLIAQVMGLRKGDAEAVVIVLADSVETTQSYSDAFTAMIRSCGGAAAKPAPAPAAAGAVDLKFRMPAGWTATKIQGGLLLQRSKNDMYDKYDFRLVILPSQPLEDSLRNTFAALWSGSITATFDTTIAPLPMARRMKSGLACAYDLDVGAKTKAGVEVHGGLYILAQGKRYVAIIAIFQGVDKPLARELEDLIESAEIPGSGKETVALFARGDLVGNWTTSDMSLANYVTSSGAYAGDASIATASYVTLNGDGSFRKVAMAVTSSARIKESDEGTWTFEDAELRLTAKGKTRRYSVFGVGADPKVGAFLVLSTYADQPSQLDLTNPRGPFQAEWFKAKK